MKNTNMTEIKMDQLEMVTGGTGPLKTGPLSTGPLEAEAIEKVVDYPYVIKQLESVIDYPYFQALGIRV